MSDPFRLYRGAGFSVFDIANATGGVVVPDTIYGAQVPQLRVPRRGDQLLEQLYGVDMVFEQGDFRVTANSDLKLTRGLGAFKANLARSLAIPKGDIFWRPNYGIGLVSFLNAPATAANIEEIKNRITATIGADPAVEEITRLEVKVDQFMIGLVEIFVDVVISGQPASVGLAIQRE